MPDEITIYTDGAASGNPGPGGYGTILIYGRHRLENLKASGLQPITDELMAVIAAWKHLKNQATGW